MARDSGGKIVNRQELADILGVSLPTINEWVRQKMPYLKKGGLGIQWEFDTAAVIQWRADLAAAEAGSELSTIEEIEKEIAQVKLDHDRLKYALDAGQVVPLDQIERRLAVVFAEIRTGIRNIPSRVISMLVGETDEARFKSILREEIDRTLTALAAFDTNTLDESLDNDTGKAQ